MMEGINYYGDTEGLLHSIELKYCTPARTVLLNVGTSESSQAYERFRTAYSNKYSDILTVELRPKVALQYNPPFESNDNLRAEIKAWAEKEFKDGRKRLGKRAGTNGNEHLLPLIAAVDILECEKEIKWTLEAMDSNETSESTAVTINLSAEQRISLAIEQQTSLALRLAGLMERIVASFHAMALNDIHLNGRSDSGAGKKGKGTRLDAIRKKAIELVTGVRRQRFIDSNGNLDETALQQEIINSGVCVKNTYYTHMTKDLLDEVKKALLNQISQKGLFDI